MSNQKNKKLPQLKKEIKDFLSSEEGKITKKNVFTLGLSLIILGALLSRFMKADIAQAGSDHTSHGSHASHGSHGSHGSHSSGGWC